LYEFCSDAMVMSFVIPLAIRIFHLAVNLLESIDNDVESLSSAISRECRVFVVLCPLPFAVNAS